jgi:hypothetical protein
MQSGIFLETKDRSISKNRFIEDLEEVNPDEDHENNSIRLPADFFVLWDRQQISFDSKVIAAIASIRNSNSSHPLPLHDCIFFRSGESPAILEAQVNVTIRRLILMQRKLLHLLL